MKIIYEQDDHEHVAVMAVKGEITVDIAKKHVPKGQRFKIVEDVNIPETYDFTDNDGMGERV